MNNITLICDGCSKSFEKYKGEYDRQLKKGKVRFFCGFNCAMVKCGKERRSPTVVKSCVWCKKEFTTINHNYFSKKCCSEECSNNLNKHREESAWADHIKKPYISKFGVRPSGWTKGYAFTKEKEESKRLKLSIAAKKNIHGNYGGYKQRSGRGKQGWYKGYWCQSSWELAWIMYQLDHGISFKRNTQGFDYEFEGVVRKYYPDFKLEEDEYVEIKGYSTPQWKEKESQFKHKLHVIGKEEITPYVKYAKDVYGKDFVKLLESKVAGAQPPIRNRLDD